MATASPIQVADPVPADNLDQWRVYIQKLIRKFDLLPGLQAICKGRFKGFPNYQVKIIREAFKTCAQPSVIVGGREIGKSFPLAFGFFLRALVQPNFELFLVPGEKIDQAKVALRYMDILTRKSKVVRPISGVNKKLNIEWTTISKQWANGSLIKALAPNDGVVSEHGSVWCDEYQYLPENVDKALDGFDNRPGDRRWMSGTAEIRGSPLHRAYKTALIHSPKNVMNLPVALALDAGILSRESVESKKMENGGKLDPVAFDAWFNGIFPEVGSLAFHPQESSATIKEFAIATVWEKKATGVDPGTPINRAVIAGLTFSGQVHVVKEFEFTDAQIRSLPQLSIGQIMVEHGEAFHGGYNYPFHNSLDMFHVPHVDSMVEGEGRDVLFSNLFQVQARNEWFINPKTCPNCWRACEEQTFDSNGKMDKLPLSHWIFAMMHAMIALRRQQQVGFYYHPD